MTIGVPGWLSRLSTGLWTLDLRSGLDLRVVSLGPVLGPHWSWNLLKKKKDYHILVFLVTVPILGQMRIPKLLNKPLSVRLTIPSSRRGEHVAGSQSQS